MKTTLLSTFIYAGKALLATAVGGITGAAAAAGARYAMGSSVLNGAITGGASGAAAGLSSFILAHQGFCRGPNIVFGSVCAGMIGGITATGYLGQDSNAGIMVLPALCASLVTELSTKPVYGIPARVFFPELTKA